MIQKCNTCHDYRSTAAAYQNAKYGAGNRVHNPLGKNKKGTNRCTVCGHEAGPGAKVVAPPVPAKGAA